MWYSKLVVEVILNITCVKFDKAGYSIVYEEGQSIGHMSHVETDVYMHNVYEKTNPSFTEYSMNFYKMNWCKY